MVKAHAGLVATPWLVFHVGCLMAADHEHVLADFHARSNPESVERGPNVPTDEELEMTHARIGRVYINRRDIFDTSNPAEDTRLFHLANQLHVLTRSQTIESQLLFHAGDRYEGRLLQESARILRSTRYLHDA